MINVFKTIFCKKHRNSMTYYAHKEFGRTNNLYKGLKSITRDIPSVFIASFLSLLIPALIIAIELWIAGRFPLKEGLILMATYHIIIGLIAEGLISTIVYSSLKKVRPDLLSQRGVNNG